MANGEKWIPVEDLRRLKGHPVYGQYGRNCLTKRFTEKGMSILKALSGREKIDEKDIRDSVGWGIPEVLKGRGSSPV